LVLFLAQHKAAGYPASLMDAFMAAMDMLGLFVNARLSHGGAFAAYARGVIAARDRLSS
jgi:hypothetical protein